ncbi:hypothetical protein cyc_08283 [Cyclospora cayetanensis]|uniref:Uncharacterized protein n=1 Tax=Cyclospora cayetanensis TaxID=88456 RepID=A0A1D3D6M1_9EIME|nr:hypothetical protein cyc_08283 [Cyclospora cayetanensis]
MCDNTGFGLPYLSPCAKHRNFQVIAEFYSGGSEEPWKQLRGPKNKQQPHPSCRGPMAASMGAPYAFGGPPLKSMTRRAALYQKLFQLPNWRISSLRRAGDASFPKREGPL